MRQINCSAKSRPRPDGDGRSSELEEWKTRIDSMFVDAADWSSNFDEIYFALTLAPPLSKYASKERQLANCALVEPTDLRVSFVQHDLLQPLQEELCEQIREASLVTLMFTLNELYCTSIGAATRLLLHITGLLKPGALFLVVDSPGSYSTINLGKEVRSNRSATERPTEASSSKRNEKQYPMHWLLDHTLLKEANSTETGGSSFGMERTQWVKIEEKESEWFRLSPKLNYPIVLEDMRYQLHLYRKT